MRFSLVGNRFERNARRLFEKSYEFVSRYIQFRAYVFGGYNYLVLRSTVFYKILVRFLIRKPVIFVFAIRLCAAARIVYVSSIRLGIIGSLATND